MTDPRMNDPRMNVDEFTGINRLLKSEALQVLFNKMTDGTLSEFIDDWKWIFSYSRKYKRVILFYLILGLLSSTMGLGAAYLSRILINIVVEKQFEYLWVLVTTLIVSTLFSLTFGNYMGRVSLKISIDVNNDIQAGIFDKIIDAKWAELNRYPNGDLLNRFNNDVGTVAGNAIAWIPNVILTVYNFVLTFIILVRMDVTMAWIAILSAPFLMVMSKFILRKMRYYRKRVMEMNSQVTSFEVETFYNFDTIKSLGLFGHYSKALRGWQQKYKQFNLEYNMFSIKTNIALTLVSTLVSTTAFGYCLYRLWTGQILYGDMTFFLEQRGALSGQFNSLIGTLPGMINSSISAHRIRELVDLPKEEHNPESLAQLSAIAADGVTVELKDVTFAYREGENVYEQASLIARPGEIIAVLGGSGKGKTTLLRLILGLVTPNSGLVSLSGSDGKKLPVNADLRRLFSYVPQGNTITSGTIADNMRVMNEDITDEQIEEVLKQACAWEFIEQLPEGVNTRLGEQGKGLSEGQAQRLAIARALLREAPILLLDEATSALDMATEDRVLDNIIRRHPNRTCIVSTHRPSVLKQCQRIYRIIDGHIIQLTPPEVEELLRGANE